MRLEIPECKRCCCCIPLRHGVLVFGYLNLVFSIFVVVLEFVISFKGDNTDHTMTMIRGVQFYTHVWFAAVLYATEIIFDIVLLVGAHMKKTRLMRAYYYYSIITTLASLVTFVVLNSANICVHGCLSTYFIISICFVLGSVGIQVYLLLLIRSELQKIKQKSRLSYVNHASEVVVEPITQNGRNPF